ncbi:MAG TPA: hypothetical protein VGU65_10945 [Frateuria sp.]|uniref:hypothetical protein n=1 Tax=Frateuria sp. TaxID=2211372 RepID=UPI002DE8B7DE|nr:hypothetical protein [Frateuria sp.]
MPDLSGEFARRVRLAAELARKLEIARGRLSGRSDRALLHPERLELVYEMAFFRCYLAWEEFLEQAFIRYLAGYISPLYAPVAAPGKSLFAGLVSARQAYLSGKQYKLWHDPLIVVNRTRGFLAGCPIETVIQSAISDLDLYAKVRHRIAHAQENAKANFDAACVTLLGHTIKGSKPGKLLRSRTPLVAGGATRTWLEDISNVYVALAAQIA